MKCTKIEEDIKNTLSLKPFPSFADEEEAVVKWGVQWRTIRLIIHLLPKYAPLISFYYYPEHQIIFEMSWRCQVNIHSSSTKMEEPGREGKPVEALTVWSVLSEILYVYVLITYMIYIPLLEILNIATICWLIYVWIY